MSTDSLVNLSWMDEHIASVPKNNWLYRLSCLFLLKKKLTYKELYVILYTLNEKHLGIEKSKERSLLEILKIYKYNNNTLPDGID